MLNYSKNIRLGYLNTLLSTCCLAIQIIPLITDDYFSFIFLQHRLEKISYTFYRTF